MEADDMAPVNLSPDPQFRKFWIGNSGVRITKNPAGTTSPMRGLLGDGTLLFRLRAALCGSRVMFFEIGDHLVNGASEQIVRVRDINSDQGHLFGCQR